MAQDEAGGGLTCRRCDERRPAVCAECDADPAQVAPDRGDPGHRGAGGVDRRCGRGGHRLPRIPGRASEPATAWWSGPRPPSTGWAGPTLVAFLDIDQHLLAPRFAAGEETLSLLARAARLVGARAGGGRVLVQTRIPDHEVLRAAVHADPGLLVGPERAAPPDARASPRSAPWPPFGGPGGPAFAEALAAGRGGRRVSPVEADRWLVRAPDHATLCDGLAAVPRPAERLRVEVDPTDA